MIKKISHDHYSGSFISFHQAGSSPSGKTEVWAVDSSYGSFLGAVRWFGRWRKYAFYPEPNTIFETTCLGELKEFLDLKMAER